MAYTISIPFHAAKLRFITGDTVLLPVQDKHALHLNARLKELAEHYADTFQRKLLNEGQFIPVLDERMEGPYDSKSLRISFPGSSDRFTHPPFDLDFGYILRHPEDGGFWGMVPVLGLETYAHTEAEMEKNLEELIRLEFTRKERLRHLQGVVSVLWFDTLEILDTQIKVQFPSLKELEEGPVQNRENTLLRFGHFPKITKPSSYGREEELQQLARTLKSPYIRNVALVGANGVGKTALVWELIRRKSKLGIQEEILETTASLLIKELTGDFGWQENLALLCRELQNRKVILYVRNLSELFEVGKYEGNTVSIGDYLLPFLSRGEVTLIGECTPGEKSRIDLNNPGFLSQFLLLNLEEPIDQQLEDIILKKVKDIADDQKVELTQDVIRELIRLNKRFTPYAGFPGKPIRFLESLLLHKKSLSVRKPRQGPLVLSKSEIIQHFCMETGMPPFMVDPMIPISLEDVRERFASNVFGQEGAVESLVNILASVKTALTRSGKPIASFLFVGPTGVGKTELVKVLAEFMFGNRDRLTRFDMSEFSSPWSVMNLVGQDSTSEGLLINAARREPFSVILFDEIEKAHYTFYDFLLQLLSEGRLTDNKGNTANFCSTIIILTSNIGAANLGRNRIGWKKEQEASALQQYFLQAVQLFFRPELFNRIDQVIAFQPLSRDTMRMVVDRELRLLRSREGIRGRKMSLRIGDEVLDFLAQKGYNPDYGARYLQRTIQEEIAIPLAYQLNQWDALENVEVSVTLENDKPVIHAGTDPLNMDLLMEELEKFNLANITTDKRKEVQRQEESTVFLKLTNELSILERQKEDNPGAFWKDATKARQYDQYLKIKDRIAVIKKEIGQLENQIGLACMGFAPYQPTMRESVEDWKTGWEKFREDLFHQLYPGDSCWLSIYGKSAEPILKIYYYLLEQFQFKFSGHAFWFRPIPAPTTIREQMDTVWIPTLPSGKEHFLMLPWSSETDWKPPHADSELYGVHWKVEGQAAWWLLKDEAGIQKWIGKDKDQHLYAVSVTHEEPLFEGTIHRKEYYQASSVRRTITPTTLSDSIYKIKDPDFNPFEWVDYLSDLLKERLINTIEEALE